MTEKKKKNLGDHIILNFLRLYRNSWVFCGGPEVVLIRRGRLIQRPKNFCLQRVKVFRLVIIIICLIYKNHMIHLSDSVIREMYLKFKVLLGFFQIEVIVVN